jgi:hypothetical protein
MRTISIVIESSFVIKIAVCRHNYFFIASFIITDCFGAYLMTIVDLFVDFIHAFAFERTQTVLREASSQQQIVNENLNVTGNETRQLFLKENLFQVLHIILTVPNFVLV